MSQELNEPNLSDAPQSFPPPPANLPPSYAIQNPGPLPVAPYGQSPAQAVAGPAKVLGIFFIVIAVLGFLAAFFIGAIIAMMPASAATDPNVNVAATAGFITIVSVFVGLLAGVLPLITGIGLIRGASWGRVLAIVNSCLLLLSIPFGTLLGGFTLYYMLRAGAKEGWDQLSRGNAATY